MKTTSQQVNEQINEALLDMLPPIYFGGPTQEWMHDVVTSDSSKVFALEATWFLECHEGYSKQLLDAGVEAQDLQFIPSIDIRRGRAKVVMIPVTKRAWDNLAAYVEPEDDEGLDQCADLWSWLGWDGFKIERVLLLQNDRPEAVRQAQERCRAGNSSGNYTNNKADNEGQTSWVN